MWLKFLLHPTTRRVCVVVLLAVAEILKRTERSKA